MPRLICGALVAVLVTLSAGAAGPVVFWASDPVRPDETVLVQGSDLGGAAAVVEMAKVGDGERAWTKVPVLQGDEQSLKFVVPAAWEMGVFAYRITAGGATSAAKMLNAPDPWWVQGDEGQAATPGGWIRVMGKSLAMNDKVAGRLVPEGGAPIELRPVAAEGWSLRFDLPRDLPAKSYTVKVHNGAGGDGTWREAGTVQIKAAPKVPEGVFSVLETYGEKAGEEMRKSLVKYNQPIDRTDGILAALKKAKENGGGVVFFPAGRYLVKGPLAIPDRTILRGEGMGVVTIWWGSGHFNLDGGGPQGRAKVEEPKPPGTLISGADFEIEEMSFYLPLEYQQGIVADRRLRMRKVRTRIDHYWLVQGRGSGNVVRAGANFAVTDCDILAKGEAVVSGKYGVIARNRIMSNKCNTPMGGARCLLIENNLFVSMDPTAYQNIAGVGRDIYYGHNKQEALYAHQSDYSFTFDAGTGGYIGKLAAVNGTKVTLGGDPTYAKWAPETSKLWRSAVVCVLDGRGAGQWRDVTANAGRAWEIDRPFDVAPDDKSTISIVPFNGRVLVIGNRFEDGNWVNAGYGTSIEVVCAENQVVRCANVMNYGVHSQDWYEPSWFVQYFDNVVSEGQTGIGSNGSGRKGEAYDGPLTCWAVHRRHTITADNGGGISISGVLRDAVIEGCVMRHPASTIKVDAPARGVVVRKNTFEAGKAKIEGSGLKEAAVEQ